MAVLYKREDGRELTDADLGDHAGFGAPDPWDEEGVPDRALQLVDEARAAAQAGRHDDALQTLAKAQAMMTSWPEPTYEAARVFLLKGDAARAEEFYGKVAALAPRGFLREKEFADALRRERDGTIPAGSLKEYLRIEANDDAFARRVDLEMLLAKAKAFPAAWLLLAGAQDDPQARLDAAESGLAHAPDPETKGLLEVAKANALAKLGRREEAMNVLGPLALDEAAPVCGVQAARMSFKALSTRKVEVFSDAEALRVALWKTAGRQDRKHLAELCNKNKELIFQRFNDWLLPPPAVDAVPAKRSEWEAGLRGVAQYFSEFGDASLSAKLKAFNDPSASLNMLWTQARGGGTMLGAYANAFLRTNFIIPSMEGDGGPVPYLLELNGVGILPLFTGAAVPAGFFDRMDTPPDGFVKMQGAAVVESFSDHPSLHFSVNPHTSADQTLPPDFIAKMRAYLRQA